MANNPFQTPANPYPLVHSNGILFNTTARTSRLTSQWASPSGPAGGSGFSALKTNWASTSIAASNTGFGHALKSLATNSTAEANSAFTAAIGEPAVSTTTNAYETDNPRAYAHSVAYTYAWCNGLLSSGNNTTLLSRIEANQIALEANIGALGKFLVDGMGNGNVGMPGYIANWIAADGQPGITDRTQNVTNLVQNTILYINQQYNEGIWTSYDNLFDLNMIWIIAFHTATGNESLLTTRCPAILARGEILARCLDPNGNNFFPIKPHDHRLDATGTHIASWPANAWACSMYSDVTRDLTMAWVRDQQVAHCTPTVWSHLQLASDPSWLGFFFYDSTLTGQSPAQQGLTLCKGFPVTGVAQFRSGWNQGTDVVANFCCGPVAQNDHDVPTAGHFDVRVGTDFLISYGYNYSSRNNVGTWEHGVPTLAGEVGDYTMCKSCPSFSPSATEATRVDRDGSASTVVTTGSSTTYNLSNILTNGVRQTRLAGVMGTMTDNGTLAKITGDYSAAFPQITTGKRTVGYIRPASGILPAIFVIYDQFTAPSTINQIRANFWTKFKPVPEGPETVLQGTSTAGVVSWPSGDSVVATMGTHQVTIQITTPFNTINGVGGAGFESFFDAPANATTGYATSGGGNLDFVANGGDSRCAQEFPWFNNNAVTPGQIQWRTSFQTTQALAKGEMLFVITVDAKGTTAPEYTRAQALALLNPGVFVPMPGKTQASQRISVDFNLGTSDAGLPSIWCGLFLTVPADDGTGGVEVSGTNYARVACPSGTFTAASGGSPATASNANVIQFATAGSDWAPSNGLTGWGLFKAASGGTAHIADYLGSNTWSDFTASAASPMVVTTGVAHNLSNGNTIAVTAKFGGTLPTLSQGSFAGLLTVQNVTTNTFTLQTSGAVALNASAAGSGSYRLVVAQQILNTQQFSFGIGALVYGES